MFRIKKKVLLLFLTFGIVLCMSCGEKEKAGSGVVNGEDIKGGAQETDPMMEGAIEVVENLPDRDIKVPTYLMGENEEKLKEENYDGGDFVCHLSGEDQAEMARQTAKQIEDSISQVLTDKEHYPNIVKISVSPGCTEFNVAFSDRELSLYENVLHMSLCIVGDRFQLYQGKREDELMTVVNYIDAETGEIFNTIDSGEVKNPLAS